MAGAFRVLNVIGVVLNLISALAWTYLLAVAIDKEKAQSYLSHARQNDKTGAITQALDILEIRVLDHVVVGGADHVSLAERGMLYRREKGTTAPRKPRRKKRQKAA